MEWFIAVIAICALGVAAVVATGGVGQMDKDPVRDTYAAELPEHPLTPEDLRRLRFGVGLRGYAMDQVDALVDRLALEIEARDARIAELSEGIAPPDPGAGEEPYEPVAVAEVEDVGTATYARREARP